MLCLLLLYRGLDIFKPLSRFHFICTPIRISSLHSEAENIWLLLTCLFSSLKIFLFVTLYIWNKGGKRKQLCDSIDLEGCISFQNLTLCWAKLSSEGRVYIFPKKFLSVCRNLNKKWCFVSGLWWCHRGAGYIGWGILQGQYIDYAAAPRQSHTLDFWYNGKTSSCTHNSFIHKMHYFPSPDHAHEQKLC